MLEEWVTCGDKQSVMILWSLQYRTNYSAVWLICHQESRDGIPLGLVNRMSESAEAIQRQSPGRPTPFHHLSLSLVTIRWSICMRIGP